MRQTQREDSNIKNKFWLRVSSKVKGLNTSVHVLCKRACMFLCSTCRSVELRQTPWPYILIQAASNGLHTVRVLGSGWRTDLWKPKEIMVQSLTADMHQRPCQQEAEDFEKRHPIYMFFSVNTFFSSNFLLHNSGETEFIIIRIHYEHEQTYANLQSKFQNILLFIKNLLL